MQVNEGTHLSPKQPNREVKKISYAHTEKKLVDKKTPKPIWNHKSLK